jgi:ATP-dependent Zn protease
VGDRVEVTAEATATAYHEAGHAVVALALGRGIHKVSIRPKQDWLGRCEFRKGVRPSDDFVEDEILISLGGMVAEARTTGTYDRLAADRDLRYVRRLVVQRVSDRQVERFERRMLSKTEYLLADAGNWAAVELIAAELLRLGEISGRAAKHFYDRGLASHTD